MNWNNLSAAQKVATVISGLAIAVVVINIVKPELFPMNPSTPAIAVFTLCEALISWKENRKMAYLLIGASVISLGCFILELLLS